MSNWAVEVRRFEDKWLARLAWEVGRVAYTPAGVLVDGERTEREWQQAWQEICQKRPALSKAKPSQGDGNE